MVQLKLENKMSFDKIRDHLRDKLKWLSPEGRPITTSFVRDFFKEDRLLQLAGYGFWNRTHKRKSIGAFSETASNKESWNQ